MKLTSNTTRNAKNTTLSQQRRYERITAQQVSDNIRFADLVAAFEAFHRFRNTPNSKILGLGRLSSARCSKRLPGVSRSSDASSTSGSDGNRVRPPPPVDLRPRALPERFPGLAAALWPSRGAPGDPRPRGTSAARRRETPGTVQRRLNNLRRRELLITGEFGIRSASRIALGATSVSHSA